MKENTPPSRLPSMISHIVTATVVGVLVFGIAFGWTNPSSAPPVGSGAISVDSAGNVGIGTTVPGKKLHVKETANAQVGRFESTLTGGSAQIGILSSAVGGTEWRIGTAINNALPSTFSIHDQTTGATRLSIDKYGQVDVKGGFAIAGVPQTGMWNNGIPISNSVDISPDPSFTSPFASMAIGVDGLPLVAYGGSSGGLKALHCGNVSCTLNNVITPLDTATGVGRWVNVVIGGDQLPFIAYTNSTGSFIKTIKCTDTVCSTFTGPTTVSGVVTPLSYISVAIGSSGNPMMSYSSGNADAGDIRFIQCGNASCSSLATNNISLVSITNAPRPTAIAMGGNGSPIIAYQHRPSTNGDLKFIACSAADCSSKSGPNDVVSTTDDEGWNLSLTVGNDGLPLMVYAREGDMGISSCSEYDCSGSDSNVKFSPTGGGTPSYINGVTIGLDGFPLIPYQGIANSLWVLKCGSSSCSTGNSTISVATPGGVSTDAVKIGSDGLPIVLYRVSNKINMTHCGSDRCISNWTRR